MIHGSCGPQASRQGPAESPWQGSQVIMSRGGKYPRHSQATVEPRAGRAPNPRYTVQLLEAPGSFQP